MTTNIDRAAEIMRDADRKSATDPDINRYCYPDEYAHALADAGLLTPDPQIIRTVEELDALGSETVVQRRPQFPGQYSRTETAGDLADFARRWGTRQCLPAVVVAPAAQVRAARKALEEA